MSNNKLIKISWPVGWLMLFFGLAGFTASQVMYVNRIAMHFVTAVDAISVLLLIASFLLLLLRPMIRLLEPN